MRERLRRSGGRVLWKEGGKEEEEGGGMEEEEGGGKEEEEGGGMEEGKGRIILGLEVDKPSLPLTPCPSPLLPSIPSGGADPH